MFVHKHTWAQNKNIITWFYKLVKRTCIKMKILIKYITIDYLEPLD